jgi:hypothetical protein
VDTPGGTPSRKLSEINGLANFGLQVPGVIALWGKILCWKELVAGLRQSCKVASSGLIAADINLLLIIY